MKHLYRTLFLAVLAANTVSAGEEFAVAGAHSRAGAADVHTPSRDSIFVLEHFDCCADQVGRFPEGWEGRTGWWQSRTHDAEDLYYRIRREDEDLFLRAETVGRATNAGRRADIDLQTYNLLRWRWRVYSLPQGGNEQDRGKNDSAAAVRLVFPGGWIPRTLKYVWSATLPVGTETQSPLTGRTKVVVLQSGPERRGEWVWKEVNAYEDYKRLFGHEPPPVRAFAILTDSDNVRTPVKADYDDFMFLIARPNASAAALIALKGQEVERP